LTFNYTVEAGNTSADLSYAATTSLALNGGTINDVATNAGTLTLPAPGAAGSLSANKVVVIDTTAPTVTGVSSPLANGSYKAAQIVPLTVTFSEAVTVAGTPQLTLSTGTPATTSVNYTSGSGTTVLTFNYTVAAGNTSADLDYAATGSLALNLGTIRDAATNNATLTLAAPGASGSLGANKDLVIDTTKPLPTALALANGTGTVGTVDRGDTVTITYSEPLKVSALCSTWSGDGSAQSVSDATLTITDGGSGNDSLSSVSSPTCTFNLGSVGLGSKFWVGATTTFGASGTKSSIQWNATTKVLTITLGTASAAGGTGIASVTPTYTPSALISDPAGNTMTATAFNGTPSRF
jgi:hypothetical protein